MPVHEASPNYGRPRSERSSRSTTSRIGSRSRATPFTGSSGPELWTTYGSASGCASGPPISRPISNAGRARERRRTAHRLATRAPQRRAATEAQERRIRRGCRAFVASEVRSASTFDLLGWPRPWGFSWRRSASWSAWGLRPNRSARAARTRRASRRQGGGAAGTHDRVPRSRGDGESPPDD
jgi:hypothetical protein